MKTVINNINKIYMVIYLDRMKVGLSSKIHEYNFRIVLMRHKYRIGVSKVPIGKDVVRLN